MTVLGVAYVLAFAVILFVAPLNWLVTWRLWRLSREHGWRVLHERTLVSLSLSLIATIFALVFLNNEQPVPWLDIEETRIITRSATFALVIPALYWLYLYRKS